MSIDIKEAKKWMNENWYGDYKVPAPKKPHFMHSMCVGGSSGGDCWGGESQRFSTRTSLSDSECSIEFEYLDEFLTEFFPNISYLMYKKMLKELGSEVKFHSESDYYGNHTDYEYIYIDLEKLVDFLNGLTP